MSLTRDQILAAKPRTVPQDVPELGGSVNLSVMTGKQREELFTWLRSVTPEGQESPDVMSFLDFRERLLAMTLRDDEGTLLFTLEDVPSFQHIAGEAADAAKAAHARNVIGKAHAMTAEKPHRRAGKQRKKKK